MHITGNMDLTGEMNTEKLEKLLMTKNLKDSQLSEVEGEYDS